MKAIVEVEAQKVAHNPHSRFFEKDFYISEIYESSNALGSFTLEVSNLLDLLKIIKPGFMVSVVNSSPDIKARMKTDPKTTFFDVDYIDTQEYVTFNKENVLIKNKFLNLLKRKDDFINADSKLAELLSHYLAESNTFTSRLLRLRLLISLVKKALTATEELPEVASTGNNKQIHPMSIDQSCSKPTPEHITELTALFKKGKTLLDDIKSVKTKIEDLHKKKMGILSTLGDSKEFFDVATAQLPANEEGKELLKINKELNEILHLYKNEIDESLMSTVENLTRAQGVFCKMRDELERLIPTGCGRRNKAFIDENDFFIPEL